ncbi:MAG: hypothetical protein AAGI34_01700 [Pseudomonadota bacterium]
MEADPSVIDNVFAPIQQISTTVWIAIGVLVAALIWLIKWAVTVLFVQGKGVSLITIPFSRVAGRILEDRFVQKLADTKTLPRLHVPATWDEFNRFNGYVAHRMQTYRELIYLVQTKVNGPSAVSLRLCVRWFEPGFTATFRTAERGFRDLDRIDEAVRGVHRLIHSEMEVRTDALERERILVEKDFEMVRIRRKHAVAERPASRWLRRRLGQALGGLVAALLNQFWSSREARRLGAEKKRLRRRLGELRTEIAEISREIFAAHEAEVVGVCLELIEHDRMFLQHLYHRFGLEVESIIFTVASGRILDLIAADTPQGQEARAVLGLGCGEHCTAEGIREQIRSDPTLVEYVGLAPEAVLEGTLEAYARVKLLTGEIALQGYEHNWIAHLPPPGEFGRAQAEYNHFSHQLGWLKKALPGMRVAPSGLVEVEGPPAEPPALARAGE